MTQRVVGLAVLERLRQLDPVSYVRFASVYKGFDDLGDFEREVVDLQKTTRPESRARGSSAGIRRAKALQSHRCSSTFVIPTTM